MFLFRFFIIGIYDLKKIFFYLGIIKIFEEYGDFIRIFFYRSLKVGEVSLFGLDVVFFFSLGSFYMVSG